MYDYFASNKVECFNLWLDHNRDWDAVALEVQRIHEEGTEARRGWVATQGKTIRETHDPEKAEQIISARKAAGMWYASDDFPEDDDETYLCICDFDFVVWV